MCKVNSVSVISCFIIILLFQACNECVESFYPDFESAIKSEAISHGWIPEFIPKSSRSIHEMHDLDTSRTWCAFLFSPDDAQDLQEVLLRNVNELPTSVKHIDTPNISWWPDYLKDDLVVEMTQRYGFKLYIVSESVTNIDIRLLLFAIDWEKGKGFFYRPYTQSVYSK
jgi:hypothetical protein